MESIDIRTSIAPPPTALQSPGTLGTTRSHSFVTALQWLPARRHVNVTMNEPGETDACLDCDATG